MLDFCRKASKAVMRLFFARAYGRMGWAGGCCTLPPTPAPPLFPLLCNGAHDKSLELHGEPQRLMPCIFPHKSIARPPVSVSVSFVTCLVYGRHAGMKGQQEHQANGYPSKRCLEKLLAPLRVCCSLSIFTLVWHTAWTYLSCGGLHAGRPRTFSTSRNRLCHTPSFVCAATSAISARALRYSLITCTSTAGKHSVKHPSASAPHCTA